MTILDFLVRNTPARWCSAALLAAVLGFTAAAPESHAATGKKRVAAKKPAKKKAPARPAPQNLAGLVRAWRESPTPAGRAAITRYAAAHPNEKDLARLALGITDVEHRDFASAAAQFDAVGGHLPLVADYAGYYAGVAHVESKAFAAAQKDLAEVDHALAPSPVAGKVWILRSKIAGASDPAAAVRILRDHFAELPVPEGDLAMGEALQTAGDLPHAVECYQRVYYDYPGGIGESKAAAALLTLRDSMGDAFPAAPGELMLHRGDRMLKAHEYTRARAEFEKLAGQLTGIDRDRARVRIGAADLANKKPSPAYHYLSLLQLEPSDADAERLYLITKSAAKLKADDDMLNAVEQLGRRYTKSPWRAMALAEAAMRYLRDNQVDHFEPLFRAVYDNFPAAEEAPYAHWKVAFVAYQQNRRDAVEMLRDHLKYFAWHNSSAAALYFLGRRAQADGDSGAARVYFTRIDQLFPNQYYGVLARQRMTEVASGTVGADQAERFLKNVTFPPRQVPELEPTSATSTRIERSRLLRSAGLKELADAELRFGARTDGQPILLGMELAASADAIHQGLRIIKTMVPDHLNLPYESLPRGLWESLLPLPYRDELMANAHEYSIDPYIMAGLIRQESEFNPNALSPARAYGLTQVLPSTGRMFARKVGIKRLTSNMLYQPSTNLKLGSAILQSMVGHRGGKWEPALASYNAGPNRVSQWLGWYQYKEPAEFVETIPITETRDYVQAVLRNAELYRRLYQRAGTGTVASNR